MKKQHKMIVMIGVVLALVFSIVYHPYSGRAENSDAAKAGKAGAAPAGDEAASADTKEAAPAGDAASSAAESATAAKPSLALGGAPKLYPVTATRKAAENDVLELYIDPTTANIRLVNKRTKKEWHGAPQVERRVPPNNKKFIDSPVHIKYTEGADITQTYSLKTDAKTKVKVSNIDQGVRAEFDFTAKKLKFAVEYRLRDDGLEVTIPDNSIKEEGMARLISIDVLPFFNGGKETEKGAIFLPDGSGALMVFRKNHPKYFSGYSEPVYGPDRAFKTQYATEIMPIWTLSKPPKEAIALPVFGSYRDGMGFLGIITKGDKDALINGVPAGIRNIPLYHTSAEFVYRKQDVIFIGNSGQIPLFQGKKLAGDRQVRYVLLEDQEANYVGMAKAYRDYLVKEQGVKPVVSKEMPMNVQLLGGIVRDEIIGSTFIKMTTFEQARGIIDDYAAKGVTNLELTISGWSKGGVFGNQPDHFPVGRQLGGASGLKELIKYAKDKGVSVYLQANYVRPFSKSDGFTKRSDAVRGIDREVLKDFNTFYHDGWSNKFETFYLMKPERVFKKRVNGELDHYADLGVSGVSLQYMGDTIYSDLDPGSPSSREQTAGVWMKTLEAFRTKVGKTVVDYGFAYTFGKVDRIDNAPLDSSHFVYTDHTVPFYQIALHGLIPYTAKPTNLRDDAGTEFLRAIEYGALPSYKLTREPSTRLQRTIGVTLFSSDEGHWLEPSVAEYKQFAELYKQIGDQPITNHEQLSQDVYRTTYANGTQVIVNYGKGAADVGGISVKGQGYAVTGGGN